MFSNDFTLWVLVNSFFVVTLFMIFSKKELFIKNKRIIMTVAVTLLLTSQYFRYFEEILFGSGEFRLLIGFFHYPCHVGTLFAIIYFIKQNRWTKALAFCFSVGGLVSIVAPGGNIFQYGNTDFTYTIDHMILAILPVFIVVIDGFDPSWKTVRNYTIASVLIVYAFIPFVYANEERAKLDEFTSTTFEVDLSKYAKEMTNPTIEFTINEKNVDESGIGDIVCDDAFICIFTPTEELAKKSSKELNIHLFDDRKEVTINFKLKENNVEDFYYVNEQILWSDLVPNAPIWVWPFAYGLSAFVFG